METGDESRKEAGTMAQRVAIVAEFKQDIQQVGDMFQLEAPFAKPVRIARADNPLEARWLHGPTLPR